MQVIFFIVLSAVLVSLLARVRGLFFFQAIGSQLVDHYDGLSAYRSDEGMQKIRKNSRGLVMTFLMMALTALPSTTWADGPDQTLIELLDQFLAGASNNDLAAHERFWSDDLVYTSSSGTRFGKADIIGPMQEAAGQDGEESGDEANDEPATVYTREALLVRVYGDTAVITFRLVGTTQAEPVEVQRYYNTGTFLLRDGEWRAVAWQATKIPGES
jgi:hypothetical protein